MIASPSFEPFQIEHTSLKTVAKALGLSRTSPILPVGQFSDLTQSIANRTCGDYNEHHSYIVHQEGGG